jgi:acetylornithine deacetylase
MVSLLRDLVRERSTLGNERSAQEVIHAKWQSLGLEPKMWEPTASMFAGHPAFAPVEWDFQGRPNVTAVLSSPTGQGRSLVLNGHIDVVSPEPISMWTVDPWEGAIVDGRMYGRGTADMKGGIAMMALALESLLASDVALHGDVILETVIEEEASGNGTLACRLAGYNADGAVICEPYRLQASIATMGVMWFRVTVQGSGAHASRTFQAVNAIEKCFPLVKALRQLEEQMNLEVTHPRYRGLEHPVNLNLGKMHGGDWPSSVPALCEFECRISYPPGVSPSEMQQRVEACLTEASMADPWLIEMRPTVTYYGLRADGSDVDSECPLIRVLGDCHRHVLGEDMGFYISCGSDDTHYFNNYFDTTAVGYGPRGGGSHGADEYVELESIVAGAKVLACFVMEWCGVANTAPA